MGSSKSFMTLSKDECKEAANACMANSNSKYSDAIALSKIGSYGNASSQLMLSLEEMMKSTILFMDGNGFQFRNNVKGLKNLFENHKLRYFLAFALSIINVLGQDLKKGLIWTYENPKEIPSLKPSNLRVQKIINNWVAEKLDFLMQEILWFTNADLYRQEGFYVDYDKNLKSPLAITEMQFQEFKLRIDNFRSFIREFQRSFDISDSTNAMNENIAQLQKTFFKDGYYQHLGKLVVMLNRRDNNEFKTMTEMISKAIVDFQNNPDLFSNVNAGNN
jgi:AbiV family abortive infection protein